MVRKKVDNRVRTLIENGVKSNQRSFFVMIGDRGRDQIVNLHYMLSKSVVKARPSVLWCYKKELGFSSHNQRKMKKIKKKKDLGLNEDSPFELFITSTDIRYCYYKDTHKILGNTYGMLILQDFEALTPNLLARTIETIEGGGIIVILLKSMTSLKKLYAMSMDVHNRLRNVGSDEKIHKLVPRFNERFILSLISCKNVLFIDDELNILPLSKNARELKAINIKDLENEISQQKKQELKTLKEELIDHQPMGALCGLTKTLDQAKALLTFIEAISEKSLRSTVTLTASRGRGKSAALGLAVSAAIALGYSNIFVTSPSPENLKTFFEFVFKGFDALDYKEHMDYELIESTSKELNNCVVRVNIFHSHRQTIQYVLPQDFEKLGQAELVIIDEAAAIPLPYVKKLLGPYLIFMASTVNGYEGTGRSLSLKLIQQLREQSSKEKSSSSGRLLKEISLLEPIRYAEGDLIEKWLNDLLCLDCTNSIQKIQSGCPHPSSCDLYYVNKDTLFSYHQASESFLHRIMSLYVSSHYKNTPNDLLMISDAPAHHIFVLLGPINSSSSSSIPEIFCVIQVAFEGKISRKIVLNALQQGERSSGDLIPWTISQQFQDPDFASLSGARIVRIATHPDFQKMGYGKRALEQLSSYFEGKFTNLDEFMDENEDHSQSDNENENTNENQNENLLFEENLAPRSNLPPLLQKLSERKPEKLHYIGTSFGITLPLFRFWKKSSFVPLYIRQTVNEITGEHSCVMLRALNIDEILPDWLEKYSIDFHKRFLSLCSFSFTEFSTTLALEIENSCNLKQNQTKNNKQICLSKDQLNFYLNHYDQKRLESYSNNLIDYHVIIDLLPTIGSLYFQNLLDCELSVVQAAIIIGLSLQRKSIEDLMVCIYFFLIQVLC